VLVTLAIVLFGASGVFSQFVLAVSRIWKEPPVRGPIYSFARRHGLAFLLLGVLAVGLLASAVAGAVLSMVVSEIMALATELGVELPPLDAIINGRVVVDFIASFVLFLAAFTMIPARKPRVRDVAPGAAMTALAYSLGQIALGLYLANSNRVALVGGAGSTIAILLWVYYSAMIALYGAELTRVLVVSGKNGQEP
jgi:membrane protein